MDPLRISLAAREPLVATQPALFVDDLTLTFGELAERSLRVRRALAARGIGPGSRVALIADNSLPTAIVLHALIDHGATLVPVHPRLTPDEARVIVDDAAPDLVLRADDLRALVASSSARGLDDDALDPASPLAIVYTSGTTGRPKGAVLSRRAVLASAEASAQNLGWIEGDRWLLCMPLCHVGGLSILTRCLVARRPVVLLPRFDPDAVLAAIVRRRATLLSVVPTMLRDLLDRDHDGALSRLRVILSGGAGTSPSLIEACARRAVPVLTTYGLTEACSQIASQSPSSPYVAAPGSGRPLPGASLRIVASEAGEPGRIEIRGPMLMSGYWRGAGLPLDRPMDPDGWFDTGDLGSLDAEGRLHVHARRTDLIVTGGENVYPLEVERILESIPGIRAALVFGVPDERWGQVVAAALEIEGDLDEAALASTLAERVSAHKRPRRICVVAALPRKGPGKLDRVGVAERFGAMLREVHPPDPV